MAASKLLNLDCYAEIKSITTVGTLAKIRFVLTAVKRREENIPLKIKILDEQNGNISDYNNVFYWLNFFNTNNYELKSTNEDINFYKEIVVNIDITKENASIFSNNRWFRKIKILIYNADQVVYTSQSLSLFSSEIFIPTISDVQIKCFNTDEDNSLEEIEVNFFYDYGPDKNVTVSSSYFDYKLKLIDVYSGKIISEKTIADNNIDDASQKYGTIKYVFNTYKLTAPIKARVDIVSKNGLLLKTYAESLNLIKPKSIVFVKHNGLVKQVFGIYTNALVGEEKNIDTLYGNLEGVVVK